MFPEHIKNYYSEVFTAVVSSVGILQMARNHRFSGWGWMAMSAANTPASIIGTLGAVLRHVYDQKRLRTLLILAAGAMIILAENLIRPGSIFEFGYEGNRGNTNILLYSGIPRFSYPFILGILSILLSFGKGMFFCAPGLFLPVQKHLGKSYFLTKVHRLWL